MAGRPSRSSVESALSGISSAEDVTELRSPAIPQHLDSLTLFSAHVSCLQQMSNALITSSSIAPHRE